MEYLGGLPDTKPSKAATHLWVTELGIGHGTFGPRDKHFVGWDRIAGVGFESITTDESGTGNDAALGAVETTGKKRRADARVTVQLKDGNAIRYRVVGKSGTQVRGKVQKFLVATGVPCLDDDPLP